MTAMMSRVQSVRELPAEMIFRKSTNSGNPAQYAQLVFTGKYEIEINICKYK